MKTWLNAVLLLALAVPLRAQAAGGSGAVVRATPTLHTLLDTAALRASLARLPATPARKRTEHVFRVEFDSAGQPRAPVPAAPRAMPRDYRDAVGPLLQAALRPMRPHPGGWEALLLVEAGDPPRIEQVFLPEQPASVANLAAVGDALYRSAQAMMRADSALEGTERTVRVAMMVSEDGVASEPRVVLSSGRADVDEAALRVVGVIRFRPGLLDGESARTRAVLPIRFVFVREP